MLRKRSKNQFVSLSFVPRSSKATSTHNKQEYTNIPASSSSFVNPWTTSIYSSDLQISSLRTQMMPNDRNEEKWPIVMRGRVDRSTSVSSSIVGTSALIGGKTKCPMGLIIALGILVIVFLLAALAINIYLFIIITSATNTCITTETTTMTSITTTTATTTTTVTTTTTTTETTVTTTTETTATTTTETTATTTTATTATTTSATTTTTTTADPACIPIKFINGNFETGTSAGWTVGGGRRSGVVSSNVYPNDFLPGGTRYLSAIASTHSSIVTHGNDPSLGTLMPDIVYRGNYAWRIEDVTNGGYGSVISQEVNTYLCPDIYFAWLAVLENGGHSPDDSSLMIIELKDTTFNDTVLRRVYNAGAGSASADARFNQSGSFFYTPSWQIEHVPINTTRLGHSFWLSVLATDCGPTAHSGRVYIDSFGGIKP